ncbi:atypical kinase COQ8B, mitochondrial [Condylostylus longicornis]|uniref:atypical kinase COQ8B, mitochondrial n=1 Tax=Condylostylus longicornis TaxID=2530218 RepID=UPI00244E4E5D|nr:atypical kinase COQ8B, mitochondrial [Condylostylus longicornis]
MLRVQEILGVLRGIQKVVGAGLKENELVIKHKWANSSAKEIIENNINLSKNLTEPWTSNPKGETKKVQGLIKEAAERTYVVTEGLRQLMNIKINTNFNYNNSESAVKGNNIKMNDQANIKNELPENIDVSSITLKELEQILAKHGRDRQINLRVNTQQTKLVENRNTVEKTEPSYKTLNQTPQQINLQKPDANIFREDEKQVENIMSAITGKFKDDKESNIPNSEEPQKVADLTTIAKQRKVPSTRLARFASFGALFASLGFGTVNELAKNAVGLGGSSNVKEAFFSPANTERIVDTLCKVRGAALKLGQILSIQDTNIVSPQIVKAFERVRQAADYMPDWQVSKTISNELGVDWRENFDNFEEKPFAAASIGQVHKGILRDGTVVAVKVQYPGVAQSIESDIDNLVSMMKVWDIFPKGFFIDNVVRVAKRELNWEVDYTRESEYTEKFKEMIEPYKEYYVPKVIKPLSTKYILTTEFVAGVPLDKCFDMSYQHRLFIGQSVLKLCLRELFQLLCMQTDPNWSNFLYDQNSKTLMLIDFGSTRFYSKDFIEKYREIIIAAANDDRSKVLNISREMGFLTGYETKQMEEAHTDAVMILGEIFRFDGEFDFGRQKTTEKIAQLVPTMVAHRLCPPPEEIYSIHRKLSGIFLLCAKLNIKMNCKVFYEDIVLRNSAIF